MSTWNLSSGSKKPMGHSWMERKRKHVCGRNEVLHYGKAYYIKEKQIFPLKNPIGKGKGKN